MNTQKLPAWYHDLHRRLTAMSEELTTSLSG